MSDRIPKIFGYGLLGEDASENCLQVECLRKFGVSSLFLDELKGGSCERPKRSLMMGIVKEGDLVFIDRLERIADSFVELEKIYSVIVKVPADLISWDGAIDTTQGSFNVHVVSRLLLGVATFEENLANRKDVISNGLVSQRRRLTGRPPALDADGVALANHLIFEGLDLSEIARRLNCSRRTIDRVAKGEHVFS